MNKLPAASPATPNRPSRWAAVKVAFSGRGARIGMPSLAAVILGLVGGVAQVLNYSVIPVSSSLHAAIGIGLYFIIASGVPPLTGGAFRAALHLPAWASGLISAGMGTVLLALSWPSLKISPGVHEGLAALITVLSSLGFSASVLPIPPRA